MQKSKQIESMRAHSAPGNGEAVSCHKGTVGGVRSALPTPRPEHTENVKLGGVDSLKVWL